MTESEIINQIKQIFKSLIFQKALLIKYKWSISVNEYGQLNMGDFPVCNLEDNEASALFKKYLNFIKRYDIDIIEAYLYNRESFKEYMLDISFDKEIENINFFIKQNYPEKLIKV